MARLLSVLAVVALLAGCGKGTEQPATPAPRPTPPTAVSTPPPEYPEALACNGVGGEVQLRVNIGTDGRIAESQVQRSSGNAQLDALAQAAVRNWQFNPGTEAGRPKAQWIAVPMTFRPPVQKPERCFAIEEQQADALKAR